VVRCLVELGGVEQLHATDERGRVPMQLAHADNDGADVLELLTAFAKTEAAVRAGDWPSVEQLVGVLGTAAAAISYDGMPLLPYAASCDAPATLILQLLSLAATNLGQPESMNLCDLELKTLPARLWDLNALRSLHLRGNPLDLMALQLQRLPELTHLDLSAVGMRELPLDVCTLTSLQSLRLAVNALTTLPNELGQLTALTELDLSNVGMTELPLAVCTLALLQSLQLAANPLTTLPRELEQLASLTQLDLSNVGMPELPLVVCTLTSLRSLQLSGNALTALPVELLQLEQLADLGLANIDSLSRTAALYDGGGVAAVFNFLRDLYDDPTPAFSLKLMLLGPSQAGKSSLLRCLLDPTSAEAERLTSQAERTIGLDIKVVTLPDPQGRAPDGIELQAYDAGGHDEYQEMLNSFLTDEALCVLLGSVKQAVSPQLRAQMVQWVTSIQTCAPGSKVLLLGSRCDEAEGPTQVTQRCLELASCVREELERQRHAQRSELAKLETLRDGSTARRQQQLRTLLDRPLQVPATATAVSAKTLEGFENVRKQMLEIAFDKSLFPRFGEVQPGTYSLIHRNLMRTHPSSPSLTWADLEQAATIAPSTANIRIIVRGAGTTLVQLDGAKSQHREFSFRLFMQGELLASFTLRFSMALGFHKDLVKCIPGFGSRFSFLTHRGDNFRDMVTDEANVLRRANELQSYFQQLFDAKDVIALPEFVQAAGATFPFGCDLESLRARFLRSYTKVQKDPALVHRAMFFLRLTGKVLYHQMEHTPGGQADLLQGGAPSSEERVFLQPQWLVDVMKALVHHDLQCRLDDVDAASEANRSNVKLLGAEFLHTGTLDRRLLVSGCFLP
jgi:GTPase SAR1 family protein